MIGSTFKCNIHCAHPSSSGNGIFISELLNKSFSVVLNMVIYHSVPERNMLEFFIRRSFCSIRKLIPYSQQSSLILWLLTVGSLLHLFKCPYLSVLVCEVVMPKPQFYFLFELCGLWEFHTFCFDQIHSLSELFPDQPSWNLNLLFLVFETLRPFLLLKYSQMPSLPLESSWLIHLPGAKLLENTISPFPSC